MSNATGVRFTATAQVVAIADYPGGVGVVGVSVLNGTASANHVTVYEGTDTSGRVLISKSLAASSGDTVALAVPLTAKTGVYVTCTGAVVGTLWFA